MKKTHESLGTPDKKWMNGKDYFIELRAPDEKTWEPVRCVLSNTIATPSQIGAGYALEFPKHEVRITSEEGEVLWNAQGWRSDPIGWASLHSITSRPRKKGVSFIPYLAQGPPLPHPEG